MPIEYFPADRLPVRVRLLLEDRPAATRWGCGWCSSLRPRSACATCSSPRTSSRALEIGRSRVPVSVQRERPDDRAALAGALEERDSALRSCQPPASASTTPSAVQ